jgi:hypothetical protein
MGGRRGRRREVKTSDVDRTERVVGSDEGLKSVLGSGVDDLGKVDGLPVLGGGDGWRG